MKRIILNAIITSAMVISCSKNEQPINEGNKILQEPAKEFKVVATTPEEEGKLLIAGADCLTCHKETEKLIGPTYQEIAAKYSEKDIDILAEKIVNGGSGVWGDVPMAAHAGMEKENAKKMVKYILSLKK